MNCKYPNPFNPTTTIKFGLPEESDVTLTVYDIIGREVETILHQHRQAGYYSVNFDANVLAGGLYFYRIVASMRTNQSHPFVETKKFLLVK